MRLDCMKQVWRGLCREHRLRPFLLLPEKDKLTDRQEACPPKCCQGRQMEGLFPGISFPPRIQSTRTIQEQREDSHSGSQGAAPLFQPNSGQKTFNYSKSEKSLQLMTEAPSCLAPSAPRTAGTHCIDPTARSRQGAVSGGNIQNPEVWLFIPKIPEEGGDYSDGYNDFSNIFLGKDVKNKASRCLFPPAFPQCICNILNIIIN